MTIEEDIQKIKYQESTLCFQSFDIERAWKIGARIRELAAARSLVVAIEIQLNGQPLFYSALHGTTPDHSDWLRRKRNTVERFHKSSYLVGLELQQQNATLTEKLGLELRDYSTHGGCFPIRIKAAHSDMAIVVGTIAVSGLPQRADHELVIEVLAELLGYQYTDVALG